MVDVVRTWEIHHEQGQRHAQRAQSEDSLRSFNSALHLCETVKDVPNVTFYKHLALGALGNTKRRFGRYEEAATLLQSALDQLGHSEQSVEFSGELGVVYRHMSRHHEAKHAFETQVKMARECNDESAICRGIGNLGMINYQLSQEEDDSTLRTLAIQQLTERDSIARNIQSRHKDQDMNEAAKDQLLERATIWENIGLSRLSLCHAANGYTKEAVKVASESLKIANRSKDSTVSAISRSFYGRALLSDGRDGEALAQFNLSGTCTATMALCKEPSKENLQYLRELVEAGVDLSLVDDTGILHWITRSSVAMMRPRGLCFRLCARTSRAKTQNTSFQGNSQNRYYESIIVTCSRKSCDPCSCEAVMDTALRASEPHMQKLLLKTRR